MGEPLTVVVPTRDRPELLARCVAALRDELTADDHLIVVDSASRLPVAGALRCDLPGTSRARNAGWRAATTAQVAFVDDDVIVTPGWRDALMAVPADFVFGGVGEPPGEAHVQRPVSLAEGTAGVVVDRHGPLIPGIAGNLRVSRAALEEIGGFDERLGPGSWVESAEDLDLVDRLVLAGRTGWFEPSARAWHVQWRDGRQALRLHWAYGKGMGARLARLARTDRARARLLLPGVLRLGGVATAAQEVRSGERRAWGPPVVWRLGALVGFVVAAVRRL